MYLVWFLTIGAFLSIVLGEFGQFPFGSTTSVGLTDILLFLVLGFLAIWQVGIKREVRFDKLMGLLVGFWVVGLLSLAFSGNWRGGVYLLRFIAYSSSYYLGYSLIKSRVINIESLFKLIIWVGVLLVIGGFIQLVLLPDLNILSEFGYDPHKNRMTSSLLDPNFLGVILNISFVGCLYLMTKYKSRIYWIWIVVLGMAVVLTFSRSAYLMFGINILLLGILKFRKLLVAVVLSLVILMVFVSRFSERIMGGFSLDESASERFESWEGGIKIFQSSPIIGVGFNNIRDSKERLNLFKVFSVEGGNSGSGVDSSLLFVAATTGIVGVVIYIAWGVLVIREIKDKELRIFITILVVSLIVNSQFINSLFYPGVMLIMYTMLGFAKGVKENS